MAAAAMAAYKESFLLRLCQILCSGCAASLPIKVGSQPVSLLSCNCLPSFNGLDRLDCRRRRAGLVEVSCSIEVKHYDFDPESLLNWFTTQLLGSIGTPSMYTLFYSSLHLLSSILGIGLGTSSGSYLTYKFQ
jgi:hypothetical protein